MGAVCLLATCLRYPDLAIKFYNRPVKIAVIGAGGVGGYFGSRLVASGADVAFVARGAHLKAMQTEGLRVESPKGNLHLARVTATDDPKTLGPVDIVFFTVKLYDSESATALLPPLIGRETVVVKIGRASCRERV